MLRLSGQDARRLCARLGIDAPSPPRARRGGDDPQAILARAVQRRWPQAVSEMAGAVTGRRFRVDIGFPEARLVVEVDGWQHHGRFKSDFERDRRRQNLLVLHGWRVLRFAAGEIHRDVAGILETIEAALHATTNA